MSSAGSLVSRRGWPPSLLTTKMSALPSGRQSKAICRPSGDQLGEPASGPRNEVSRTGFSPSLPHTQISSLPERLETKTIRLPSGEYRGLTSLVVEAITLEVCFSEFDLRATL